MYNVKKLLLTLTVKKTAAINSKTFMVDVMILSDFFGRIGSILTFQPLHK